MNSQVITISSLTRQFNGTVAVDDLSLNINAGEIFGFLGHNGAGKTTTLRLLNGIIEPTKGSMTVLGIDPTVDGAKLRAHTGVLTETPSLDERLTAWDNLAIYADIYGVASLDVRHRVNELLDEFELADRAQEKVSSYSKGMKQRLSLARALLHKPELIFLDEPTSGLDPIAARHVNDMVEQLAHRESRTVILCTHNLIEAQRLCDRVAILEHGRLVALGTPSELTRQYVRRLVVEVEVDKEQVDCTLHVLRGLAGLLRGEPVRMKDSLVITISGREAIPDLLAALVQKAVRVYRIAAQDASLEQVYFALHGEEGNVQ